MPPYIAVKPCHNRGRRNPFPDTMFSENREGRKKGGRGIVDSHSNLRAAWTVVEATGALDDLLLRDSDDVGGDAVELLLKLVDCLESRIAQGKCLHPCS